MPNKPNPPDDKRGLGSRGQGRKRKPPDEKYLRRSFSLPPDIVAKLEKYEGNESNLVAYLLTKYFEAPD